ncbi:MAG TPA: hypothetical protein VGW80_06665 [Solirubrobacterales bacterium]|jgi:ABC-type Fe3+-hydroxamate transport system substrate-binding protein|nr:hypothetical protein [Solirubrobacterales bacterium]
MKFRYLLLSLTAAALVPLLAGCGSSGEEATAQTTMPLAKYAHKTDLICGNGSLEQTEIATVYLEQHPNAREVELVEPAGVPPIEKEIQELHELGLPRGHEEQAEAFLEEMEAALEALKEEPSGALSQDHNPFEHSNELAKKLGLGDCSENP